MEQKRTPASPREWVCRWPGCRGEEIAVVYLGAPLCKAHWVRAATEVDKDRESIYKKLGIVEQRKKRAPK